MVCPPDSAARSLRAGSSTQQQAAASGRWQQQVTNAGKATQWQINEYHQKSLNFNRFN